MYTIAVAVAAGAAGCVSWYCRAGQRATRWVTAAGGSRRVQPDGLSCARWAVAAGLATGAVVVALPGHGPGALPPLLTSALAVWAGSLALLGLIDRETLVLPTKLVHPAIVASGCLLVAGSWGEGQRHYLWQGAAGAGLAGTLFGAWAAVRPGALGFGDARMACLVALGAGVSSLPGTFVAVSCAPLLAGLVGRLRSRRSPGCARAAVALGPFLAVGGLLVVVARAF